MPIRVMPAFQPSMPGPPHAPKTFCAPCAATTRPTTARARANARSVEMTEVKVIDDPSFAYFFLSRHNARRRIAIPGRAVARPASLSSRSMRIDHVVINVSDFARSNAFYREVVGADIVEADGRIAYRFGTQQLNVHGPGVRPAAVARVPVAPGNS